MSDTGYTVFVFTIGLFAQLLFSARLLVQWIHSEKLKKIVTPELFWELSLLASCLFFIYGWLRNDFAIILGQSITYFIYIRNMQMQGSWAKMYKLVRIALGIFPLVVIFYSFNNQRIDFDVFFKNDNLPPTLLIWGCLGQLIFTFRFVYQWIFSEYNKKSQLPKGFWYLSFAGSLMILSYAAFRKDPVLFFGQLFGFIVYSRNIIIGKRELHEK